MSRVTYLKQHFDADVLVVGQIIKRRRADMSVMRFRAAFFNFIFNQRVLQFPVTNSHLNP